MRQDLLVVAQVTALRATVRRWRSAGETIGLVPTMGNLHDGHLALVEQARRQTDRCIVSIFVNPLQFGLGEDYTSYPRTLEADQQKLMDAQVDLLFVPPVNEIYPRGQEQQTRVEVPGLSEILCGKTRPGHFGGVATVVCKLLNMSLPDLAVFGEKDYQQLLVIRRMVEDLAIPVELLGVATVRETDGLARSSRNAYLTEQERRLAPRLYQILQETARAIIAGNADFTGLEEAARQNLSASGLRPDYVSVRRAADLAHAEAEDTQLRVLAAAYLGKARLIDNLPVERARPTRQG
jgi:pantoate--beta-alanine ligase